MRITGNAVSPNVLKARQGVAITYGALAVKNSATTMSAADRNEQTTKMYVYCAALPPLLEAKRPQQRTLLEPGSIGI